MEAYVKIMDGDFDPDLEEFFAGQIDRGEFATIEQARADFHASIEQGIADAEAGRTEDIEIVWAGLRERLANWPRAAE